MRYYVEVSVFSQGAMITKEQPVRDWREAVNKAQEMATQMFPEDPMSSRVFRAGQYEYSNQNDFGEPVVIRPVALEDCKICQPHVIQLN